MHKQMQRRRALYTQYRRRMRRRRQLGWRQRGRATRRLQSMHGRRRGRKGGRWGEQSDCQYAVIGDQNARLVDIWRRDRLRNGMRAERLSRLQWLRRRGLITKCGGRAAIVSCSRVSQVSVQSRRTAIAGQQRSTGLIGTRGLTNAWGEVSRLAACL